MILTENNIKAELSYAYLHAISAHAGIESVVAGRHSDGAGVDAVVRAKERFQAESVYTDFTVEVQLKATSQTPPAILKAATRFRLKSIITINFETRGSRLRGFS